MNGKRLNKGIVSFKNNSIAVASACSLNLKIPT